MDITHDHMMKLNMVDVYIFSDIHFDNVNQHNA